MNLQLQDRLIPGTKLKRSDMDNLTGLDFLKRVFFVSEGVMLTQIRDISGKVRTIVYGRIPLMLLEKCVIREIADCNTCQNHSATLIDRRGVAFPVLRLQEHRNIIYNSLPTYMADEAEKLARHRVTLWHFIFSTETAHEVDDIVHAYQHALASQVPIRRIGRSS